MCFVARASTCLDTIKVKAANHLYNRLGADGNYLTSGGIQKDSSDGVVVGKRH